MTNKRKFLSTTIAAITYMATNLRAGRFRTVNTERVTGIPDSWVDLKGEDVNKYAEFILDLNLKNIVNFDHFFVFLIDLQFVDCLGFVLMQFDLFVVS
mgnify:CR=1 FL=1